MSLQALPEPPEGLAICALAGECLCSEEGQICKEMVANMCKVFSPRSAGWLRKDDPVRQLYPRGRLVLRIYCQGRAEHVSCEDMWVHLCFGNLNQMSFSVVGSNVNLAFPPSREVAVLQLPAACRATSLWAAMLALAAAPDLAYGMEPWRLSTSKAHKNKGTQLYM